jgi:hypothetical protein
MAIGIENQANIIPAGTAGYPNGDIKDRIGATAGTPVNKKVYADMHQFFAKMMRKAGITANNTPDNETNGFQYLDALLNTDFVLANPSGSCAGSNFGITLTDVGSTSTLGSISLYHAIKIGKSVRVSIYLQVIVSAIGSGNNFYSLKFTTPAGFKGVVGSSPVGLQLITPAYLADDNISGVISVDNNGDLTCLRDNGTNVAVATYTHRLDFTYHCQ